MSAAKVQRKATEAYQQRPDEVLAALNTDARLGLSEAEARARLKEYGRNELTAEKPVAGIEKILRTVPGRARHPAAHRDFNFGGPMAI
jgi:magnesium-transporting ATPase (P-type)